MTATRVRWGRWPLAALLLALLLGASVPALGQNRAPVVAFIEGSGRGRNRPASITDPGPDGLTRLGELFRSQGAATRFTRITDPLPPEADVVVYVRPIAALNPVQITYFYQHLQRGGHLLLALDPPEFPGLSADPQSSGFNTLLTQDYGLTFLDGLLVAPWFGPEAIDAVAVQRSITRYTPDPFVAHPVVAPLVAYDLPLYGWGGRPMRAEPFGPDSLGAALFFTEHAYAERNRRVFSPPRDATPDPLEYNVGADLAGRVVGGGLATHLPTGSRIVVLGDSEMLQNGFGLALDPATGLARYPGNQLLAARAAAWLLGLPEERWPTLDARFMPVRVDGLPDSWDGLRPSVVTDTLLDAAPPGLDLAEARALHNNAYVYIRLDAASTPPSDVAVRLVANAGTASAVTLVAEAGRVVVRQDDGADVLIADAAYAVGEVVTLRLPLRVVTAGPTISDACLVGRNAAGGTVEDCLGAPLPSPLVDRPDTALLRFPAGPEGTTRTSGTVNIRSAPNTDSTVRASLGNGMPLAILGRNAAGDWLYVANARVEGWVSLALFAANADVARLPVLP